MRAVAKSPLVIVVGILFVPTVWGFGRDWSLTSAPSNYWQAVGVSGDGRIVAAGLNGGVIYYSTNSGATWAPSDSPAVGWYSIASTPDGKKLVAAGAQIWTSTNSGANWQLTGAPTEPWKSVAMSVDGTKFVAAFSEPLTGPVGMYWSTNSGESWTKATDPYFIPWRAVAGSADGRKVVAAGRGTYLASAAPIFLSTNYGQTWVDSGLRTQPWSSLSSSPDGSTLAAAGSEGIWISRDSGSSWALANSSYWWQGLAASADVGTLVAVRNDAIPEYPPNTSIISTSTDSGTTWTNTVFTSMDLRAAASSADGTKMFVAAYGGGIYTSQVTPSPTLNVARAGSQILLSWILPSTRFILQENDDLAPNNWIDSPISPTLNLNTYQYEALAPLSATNRFYRLRGVE